MYSLSWSFPSLFVPRCHWHHLGSCYIWKFRFDLCWKFNHTWFWTILSLLMAPQTHLIFPVIKKKKKTFFRCILLLSHSDSVTQFLILFLNVESLSCHPTFPTTSLNLYPLPSYYWKHLKIPTFYNNIKNSKCIEFFLTFPSAGFSSPWMQRFLCNLALYKTKRVTTTKSMYRNVYQDVFL